MNLTKYTAIVIIPDYVMPWPTIRIAQVRADTPENAVGATQCGLAKEFEIPDTPDDFLLIALFEGWHDNLVPL